MVTLKNLQQVNVSTDVPVFKYCIKCDVKKPLSQFKKSGKCKDGHENVCKDCQKGYRKQHYDKSPEYRAKFFTHTEPF